MSDNHNDLNVIALPMEYMNTLKLQCMSPHLLEINCGFIVIILSNIKNICDLLNGTRLLVDDIINERIFKATVANVTTIGSTA